VLQAGAAPTWESEAATALATVAARSEAADVRSAVVIAPGALVLGFLLSSVVASAGRGLTPTPPKDEVLRLPRTAAIVAKFG
jgi:hypothetical protein